MAKESSDRHAIGSIRIMQANDHDLPYHRFWPLFIFNTHHTLIVAGPGRCEVNPHFEQQQKKEEETYT